MKNNYKTLLLLNLSLCFAFLLNAQPTMTRNSVAPSIGDAWEATYMEYSLNVGPGGLNQTWDFSDINSNNAINLNFQILDPDQIQNGPSYPNADFVWHFEGFDLFNYYEVTDDSISLVGGASIANGSVGFETVFTDPEDGIQFPISYGTNYDYFSRFDQYLTGNLLSTGERYGNLNVDGFGTVITPDGTFENVLRIIITQTSLGVTTTQYTWMDVNNFIPILVYEESTDPDFTSSLYYTTPNSTSSHTVNIPDENWKAWYSKSEHQVEFNLPSEVQEDPVKLSLFTMDGKLITTKSFTELQGNFYLKLPANLSCATIIVTLETSETMGSKKVSVCRTN